MREQYEEFGSRDEILYTVNDSLQKLSRKVQDSRPAFL